MDLDDGARVRHPRNPCEYRLGTVTDIRYAPHSTYVEVYRLRFPNGEERTYPAAEVTACSRTDDRTALVAAFTDACRVLRDACRIAHDYDERLCTDIIDLQLAAYRVVASQLGVILDLMALDRPPATEPDCGGLLPDTDRSDEAQGRS